jgi:hypothetical protein
MKPNKNELRILLEDVLPPAGENCGPTRADVLALVGRARHQRDRARAVLSVTVVAVLAVAILVWQRPAAPQAEVAEAPKAAPIIVHQVNDEQLLVLLKDTPAALMEWPNGSRTLLVVEY